MIEAPQDDVIRIGSAVAGEGAPARASLFEAMNTRVVGVKVRPYVGELREVAANQAAGISDVRDRRANITIRSSSDFTTQIRQTYNRARFLMRVLTTARY